MLIIDKASFSYPTGGEIFKEISLALPENGLVHLEGENGSGKTSFLRLVAGLITPQKGELLWHGKNLHIKDISYLPAKNDSSFHHLTGFETISLFNKLNDDIDLESNFWWKHLSKHDAFSKALTTKYAFCSTGMRQLINISRTLTKKCPILLFDEPLKALDKNAKEILFEVFDHFRKDHLVLTTSHEELQINSDRLLFLKDGRFVDA